MSLTPSTEKRRDDRFRYGQTFSFRNVEHMVQRSPYAYNITYRVINDAIGKGFVLKNPDNEDEVKWFQKFLAVFNPMRNDAEKACIFDREYGKSASIMFDNGSDGLMLRVFSPINYFPEYDKKFKITNIQATERIGGVMGQSIVHTLNTDKELDKVFELIVRELETKGKGLSVIEPVWDTLYSLRLTEANMARFVVRQGGGLFVAFVPEEKLTDSAYMGRVHNSLNAIDSATGTMVIPVAQTVEGAEVAQARIESISTDQIDFDKIIDILIGSIASATGIPREVVIGSELGLKSAETNQSAYFSLLQDIQQDYIPYFEWLINTLNEKFKWFTPTEDVIPYKIVYNVREAKDEDTKLDLLLKKAELVEKLRGKISDKELGALVGMKLVEQEEIPIDEDIDDEDDEDIDENIDEEETTNDNI